MVANSEVKWNPHLYLRLKKYIYLLENIQNINTTYISHLSFSIRKTLIQSDIKIKWEFVLAWRHFLLLLLLFGQLIHSHAITRLPTHVVPIRWSKQLLVLVANGSSGIVLRKVSSLLLKVKTEQEEIFLIFLGRQLNSLHDFSLKRRLPIWSWLI